MLINKSAYAILMAAPVGMQFMHFSPLLYVCVWCTQSCNQIQCSAGRYFIAVALESNYRPEYWFPLFGGRQRRMRYGMWENVIRSGMKMCDSGLVYT